ncbi:alpha/beta hydrolase [Alphaproteobacteria bacterium]|jgi:3-oxoadipate enol-lactonase|nr:alpha/beta hydrolase [Alphaproteobacteria bacterium]
MNNKEALVFLHGVGGNGSVWEFQKEAFSDNYGVIGWDAPGYGGRDLIDPFTIDCLAEQLAKDLVKAGHKSCHLVGHSFGGMIAQSLAKNHPNKLISLTLSGTSPAFGSPNGDFQKKFLEERLKPLDEGKTLADLAPGIVPTLVADNPDPVGIEIAVASMSTCPSETYRASMKAIVQFDMRYDLQAILVPTLVLAGEKDTNAPAPMMEKMAAKIPGAKYTVLPGAGHLSNLEQPDAFNAALKVFLEAL